MKIVLDEKVCLKSGLTLQETLIALAINMGNFKGVFKNMVARGILDKDSSSLTPKWTPVLSKFLSADDEHLRQLASQMRDCYPKGKKPGTVFYFRCNEREIINKLKKFFEVYGEYTDEQIVSATKKFVASYRGDYRLLPLIKYFISKNKTVMDENGDNHIVEVSELASTLENMSDDDNVPSVDNSDDWLMSSRN